MDAERIAELASNAGTQFFHPDLAEAPDDEFALTIATNVDGTYWMTKAALPSLPAGGTTVNTASVQAYAPSTESSYVVGATIAVTGGLPTP